MPTVAGVGGGKVAASWRVPGAQDPGWQGKPAEAGWGVAGLAPRRDSSHHLPLVRATARCSAGHRSRVPTSTRHQPRARL